MKALVQRVSQANVKVEGQEISRIGNGMLVLLGVVQGDTKKDADYLVKKLLDLRIFNDDKDKMNRPIQEVEGEILLVSQFTLAARTSKGNRPSFIDAADPKVAEEHYRYMQQELAAKVPVKTGSFGAYMEVSLVNDGPVTILIESR